MTKAEIRDHLEDCLAEVHFEYECRVATRGECLAGIAALWDAAQGLGIELDRTPPKRATGPMRRSLYSGR